MTITRALTQLSDRELLAQVHVAARAERQASAQLIALLMEIDARRLYLGEGFSSLFTYCTQALHLAEHAAYNRIETARAARRFPIVLDLIREGAVTLTTIRLLAPHLTDDNHLKVLESARHKSKREVESIVAGLHPQPDLPSAIRKIPSAPTDKAAGLVPLGASLPVMAVDAPDAIQPPQELRTTRPIEVKPIAPERYKIQFTVSGETYERLKRARDLLRHSVPNGDPAIIFDRAITLLVAELERRKTAGTNRARAARGMNPHSRHIAAAVKRIVWQRDAGRCAFKGHLGRCTETGFLEYHHVVPFADGGESSAENLELRCRRHNAYEAEQWSGSVEVPLLRESRAYYGTSRQLVPERGRERELALR